MLARIGPYLVVCLLGLPAAQAADFITRLSLLGTGAKAHPGDAGYEDSASNRLHADQESLRFMVDDYSDNGEWSVHVNTSRQYYKGLAPSPVHSSDLFRYDELAHDWVDDVDGRSTLLVGYEVDRLYYEHRLGDLNLGLGRQPVDWGTGRFWQPLNVFGAFAPTALDTAYKPGIDIAGFEWYPGAYSSLTGVYAFAPEDDPGIKNSGALYFRRQVGERSEIGLLAGQVVDNNLLGASFESDWKGLGWRVEGTYYDQGDDQPDALFWIAGVDYQFSDGTLVSAEWYNNGLGTTQQSSLPAIQNEFLVQHGLQPYASEQVLGLLVDKDITPLWHGTYTFLASPLKGDSGHTSTSTLHQFNLLYSVSNESELLLSFLYASGKGFGQDGQVRSEFGSVPTSFTINYRLYF